MYLVQQLVLISPTLRSENRCTWLRNSTDPQKVCAPPRRFSILRCKIFCIRLWKISSMQEGKHARDSILKAQERSKQKKKDGEGEKGGWISSTREKSISHTCHFLEHVDPSVLYGTFCRKMSSHSSRLFVEFNVHWCEVLSGVRGVSLEILSYIYAAKTVGTLTLSLYNSISHS